MTEKIKLNMPILNEKFRLSNLIKLHDISINGKNNE